MARENIIPNESYIQYIQWTKSINVGSEVCIVVLGETIQLKPNLIKVWKVLPQIFCRSLHRTGSLLTSWNACPEQCYNRQLNRIFQTTTTPQAPGPWNSVIPFLVWTKRSHSRSELVTLLLLIGPLSKRPKAVKTTLQELTKWVQLAMTKRKQQILNSIQC